MIRERFTDAPPEHFVIVRAPQKSDFATDEEFAARNAQHKLWAKDLKRYGLLAVEVIGYAEIPTLLLQIEKRIAACRIWLSGSWPIERGGFESTHPCAGRRHWSSDRQDGAPSGEQCTPGGWICFICRCSWARYSKEAVGIWIDA